MKDGVRQILVIVSILATLVVNGLANALPINGMNTGQISDMFQVYFVPAGYVFSIWGVIYLGLIAFAVYQALPAQRTNPRLRAVGGWVILGGAANSIWIFLWHYLQFPATLAAMFVLLASLIVVYLKLGVGNFHVSRGETWAVRVPFSIYLGWITVATVANITTVLDYVKWDRFGIAPEVWMGLVLAAVVAIAGAMAFTRRDLPYTLVLLWALAGIGVKHAATPVVSGAAWVAFGLIVVAFAVARWMIKRPAMPGVGVSTAS